MWRMPLACLSEDPTEKKRSESNASRPARPARPARSMRPRRRIPLRDFVHRVPHASAALPRTPARRRRWRRLQLRDAKRRPGLGQRAAGRLVDAGSEHPERPDQRLVPSRRNRLHGGPGDVPDEFRGALRIRPMGLGGSDGAGRTRRQRDDRGAEHERRPQDPRSARARHSIGCIPTPSSAWASP